MSALLGIGAAAVLVRVAYVVAVASDRGPLIGDAETYHLLGRVLAGGHGYVRPREAIELGVEVPTAEFPPLWPLVLSVADRAGLDGADAQRLVGALIGGATVVVIGLIAARLAGPRTGAVAAMLAAVYPQLVVIDASLQSEGLAAFMVAGAVLAAVADRTGRPAGWVLVGAGLAVALAALTRSEAIVLVPGLLVPLALVGASRADRARRLALVMVPPLVLVGAWAVRNVVRLDAVVPLSGNSGTVLAGANCASVYSGDQIGLWRLDCVSELDYRAGEADVMAELRSDGVRYAANHAGRLPAVLGVRLARTFGLWDPNGQLAYESLDGRFRGALWAGWCGYVIVAVAGVVGAFRLRGRWGQGWPLLVPVAVVVVTTLVAYGNQRFRVPAEPSLVVLAAVGVAGIRAGSRPAAAAR